MERNLVAVFLLLTVAVMATVRGLKLQKNDLFQFGRPARDKILPNSNDDSVLVNLGSPFTFYGKKYSRIFINDNGVLSFVNKYDKYRWEDIPLAATEGEEHILIAPFLANVDVTVAGTIYYGERRGADRASLQKAEEKVRKYFVKNSEFKPKNLLVVTWDQVGFFGAAPGVKLNNTFQCVVASDAIDTFVIFMYETITWTTDTLASGDPKTGRGGNDPQVGFDSGNTKKFKKIDIEDFADGAISLPMESNVDPADPPGFFIYRVSDSKVYFPECKTSEKLQVYPDHGSMLGGSRLTFGGFCFSETDSIKFRFSNPDDDNNIAISEFVTCDFLNKYKATCIMPQMERLGDVAASLSVNGGSSWKHNLFTIMPINSVVAGVKRVNPWGMEWFKVTKNLEITWDSSEFDDKYVKITVMSYREENETAPTQEWVNTVIAENVTNSGEYTIGASARQDITHTNALGVIRVTATSKPDGLTLSSSVHFLGYLLSDPGYQQDAKSWSNKYCHDWFLKDQDKTPFLDELNACPCTLQQALADQARFVATPYCDSTKQPPDRLEKLDYCFARPGIKHCALGIVRNQADSECCYDGDGNLIYGQDSIYGSFSNRISQFSGAVPGLSGAATDLVPYIFCNIIGDDKSNYYGTARPTKDCRYYEPVRPAIVYGDPHFVTLDNTDYTFNGLGEYVLLQNVAGAAETSIRVEGRFQRVLNADGTARNATVLTALAVKENDVNKNKIQIEKNDITLMTLKVGDIAATQDIGRHDYQQYPDFFIIFPKNNGSGVIPKMVFLFRESKIGLAVRATEDDLAAVILLPSEYKGKNKLQGLFGSWDEDKTNDLKTPAGNTVPFTAAPRTIFDDFGQTWEVTDPLFTYSGSDKHSTFQDNNFVPIFTPPTGGVSDTNLEKVCGDDKFCRFDYLVTKKKEFAEYTAMCSSLIKETMAASSKLLMCPFLPAPSHGAKSFDDNPHHAPGSKITFTCEEGYIFLGKSRRECDKKGIWSDASEPLCIEIKCGTLNPPDHGVMEVKVGDNNVVTATFKCDEGVPMKGSKTRTCGADNKWTGEETKCIKANPRKGGVSTAVIVVIVIIVVIVLVVLVGGLVYYFKKKRGSGTEKVTRPKDSAYQAVEMKAGEGEDVELGTKKEKPVEDKKTEEKEEKGEEDKNTKDKDKEGE